MNCYTCQHRKFEQGDLSECPPGYGVCYCDLDPNKNSALTEDVAKGKQEPNNCPLQLKITEQSH